MSCENHALARFVAHLEQEERSRCTIEKYRRDVACFLAFAGGREVTKALMMDYKAHLQERGYAVRSVNSMLAAVNSYLAFSGREDCRVKALRLQQSPYLPAERELTREEFRRLLQAARRRPRLQMVLQTIAATGIRISELQYFTLEAVRRGEVGIHAKGKYRVILLAPDLRRLLLSYAADLGIGKGPLFVGQSGRPLHRSTVWRAMKNLCAAAGVDPRKVFPHSLRKLFARCFYAVDKDIARLADVLGHSSINTTRIYIMTSGEEHRRCLRRTGLVLLGSKKAAAT